MSQTIANITTGITRLSFCSETASNMAATETASPYLRTPQRDQVTADQSSQVENESKEAGRREEGDATAGNECGAAWVRVDSMTPKPDRPPTDPNPGVEAGILLVLYPVVEGAENGDSDVAKGELNSEAAKEGDPPEVALPITASPVACIPVLKGDGAVEASPEPKIKLMTHMPIKTVPAASMTETTNAMVPSTVLMVPGQRRRPHRLPTIEAMASPTPSEKIPESPARI